MYEHISVAVIYRIDVFSCSAHHERYSLATMQGETANSVQATAQHSSSRQPSKDCVIQ